MHDEKLSLTPLIDVAFLVLIFFMALPMKRLDGKLSAYLPTGNGGAPTIAEPRSVVRIHVRKDHFRLGNTRAPVARGLLPLLERLGPTHTYQIEAPKETRTQRVVDLMDLLTGLKYNHVEFSGTKLPNRDRN